MSFNGSESTWRLIDREGSPRASNPVRGEIDAALGPVEPRGLAGGDGRGGDGDEFLAKHAGVAGDSLAFLVGQVAREHERDRVRQRRAGVRVRGGDGKAGARDAESARQLRRDLRGGVLADGDHLGGDQYREPRSILAEGERAGVQAHLDLVRRGGARLVARKQNRGLRGDVDAGEADGHERACGR